LSLLLSFFPLSCEDLRFTREILDIHKNYKEKIEKFKDKRLKRDPPVWILPESMLLD